MVQTITHPVAGPAPQLGPVAKLSATPAQVRSAPPLLGEHTDAILLGFGYTKNQIAQWREEGVV
jgi:crotonobetainyl-CoA:carnitine CoA-transferase CaiB-like acyl-CoA transferase